MSLIELKKQFKQHMLAMISIAIAVTALVYNSWRNELSEQNRNYRAAGFEIMRESAHFQFLIDTVTYADSEAKDITIEQWVDGWVRVNLMVSLAELMNPDVSDKALALKDALKDNQSKLRSDELANERVSEVNRQLVLSVKEQLRGLR